jgi:Fe-S cluster assembly protein SufD
VNRDATRQVPFEGWLGSDDASPGRSSTSWLQELRNSALARLRGRSIPGTKQEAWRYTGLKVLTEQQFRPCGAVASTVQPVDLEGLLIPEFDAYRAVLVNGRFIPHLSDLEALPEGVLAGSLGALLDSDPDVLSGLLTGIAGEGVHLFSELNTAAMHDGFVLLLSRDVVLDRPVELIHLSVGMNEPRVAQPRHLVSLGAGARACLIERYMALGSDLYCTNSVAEIRLAKGARLQHSRVQLESPSAFHIAGLYVDQAADSRYEGINVGLGARWARTDLVVGFAGRRADCDLMGLYLAGDRQMMDYHLDVDHAVPECASRENFKGILHGKGRAVFDGRVRVGVDAQKTDAQLSNRNLLLSRDAEVDTKPQLEILADDVKCSHGTTVGQIDPETLFYLRSRGISASIARRMLCLGFAGEIIDALGWDPLREYVARQVGERLETAPLDDR